MKRAINILSILGIACALFLIFFLYSFEIQPPQTLQTDEQETTVFADFPLGQPRFIDFEVDEETLARLTPREQRDQLKDWLLFTVVSTAGLSTEEINQSLYDIPTIRYGYMQPVANFEYGDTRSCYIGDGKVIALLPSTPDERIDYLAHIADMHRKNIGEIPNSLQVFEYEINLDEQFALLTRRKAVNAQELFTEKYGYYEMLINSLVDLQHFMEQVDDMTFAKTSSEGLRLGGRKIKSREYRNIRVEDVAAIWQAEQKIHAELTRFYDRWQRKLDALNAAGRGASSSREPWLDPELLQSLQPRTQRPVMIPKRDTLVPSQDSYEPPLKVFSQAQYDAESQKLMRAMQEERRKLYLVDGSGFSLDPTYNYEELASFFERIEPQLRSLTLGDAPPITMQDILNAKNALTKRDEVPFLILVDKLKKSEDLGLALLGELLFIGSDKYRFQAARYDGDLQGTEVGMVLFYTDLLAKLWALDYMGTIPNRYIDDFKALTQVSISPVYKQEIVELPSTRLWFGPQDKGFQVAGNNLLFARNATRVYAASSNPLEPGVEVAPNAPSAAFLGWWNDHYEEVARYEPEYERLNEIMKWSLVISWLNEANKGHLLNFLKDVINFEGSHRFHEWVKRQPHLRFQKWDKVNFYPPGYKGAKTEAMPILYSKSYTLVGEKWTLSGGVSLAPKHLFKERIAISPQISKLSRRSNLVYDALKSNSRNLSTLDGIEYGFKSLTDNRMSVIARAKEGTKLRGRYSEVANLEVERIVSRDPLELHIETRLGGNELGNLGITRTQNGFKAAWRSRDIDEGQSLARHLSKSSDPDRLLLEHPDVESTFKLSGDYRYLVKMRGADRWMKMAPEEKPSASIAEGWQSRVAAPEGGKRNIQLAWVDDVSVSNELQSEGYIVMELAPGTGKAIWKHQPIRGPPSGSKSFEIKSGNITINGQVDPNTGAIYLRWGELPEILQKDPSGLQKLIRDSDRQQVLKAAGSDQPIITVPPTRARFGDNKRFVRHLKNNAYDEAARDLINDPQKYKQSLNQHLTEELELVDKFFADRHYAKASWYLDDLIDLYGAVPELKLHKGIAEIRRGRWENAKKVFNETIQHQGGRDKEAFLDEINARIRQNVTLPEGEALFFDKEGGQFAYDLSNIPKDKSVALNQVNEVVDSLAPIYLQDHPGLNNLDWSGSLTQSLQQVISGDLGTVIKLPRGDIAAFRPDVIYTPVKPAVISGTAPKLLDKTRFRLVAPPPPVPHTYSPPPSYSSGGGNGDDDDEKRGAIYLVLIAEHYMVTEESLVNLKSEEIPNDVLENLRKIKDQEFIGTEKFLAVLKKTIGDEQTIKFKMLILKHTASAKTKY